MKDLKSIYRGYVDCLNRQDWDGLDVHVVQNVRYDGEGMGIEAYRELLEGNFRDIPDLRFEIDVLVAEGDRLACRLVFDCHPTAQFLGLAVNGRRIRFAENAIYEFEGSRIAAVWSVLDKAAIERQLG